MSEGATFTGGTSAGLSRYPVNGNGNVNAIVPSPIQMDERNHVKLGEDTQARHGDGRSSSGVAELNGALNLSCNGPTTSPMNDNGGNTHACGNTIPNDGDKEVGEEEDVIEETIESPSMSDSYSVGTHLFTASALGFLALDLIRVLQHVSSTDCDTASSTRIVSSAVLLMLALEQVASAAFYVLDILLHPVRRGGWQRVIRVERTSRPRRRMTNTRHHATHKPSTISEDQSDDRDESEAMSTMDEVEERERRDSSMRNRPVGVNDPDLNAPLLLNSHLDSTDPWPSNATESDDAPRLSKDGSAPTVDSTLVQSSHASDTSVNLHATPLYDHLNQSDDSDSDDAPRRWSRSSSDSDAHPTRYSSCCLPSMCVVASCTELIAELLNLLGALIYLLSTTMPYSLQIVRPDRGLELDSLPIGLAFVDALSMVAWMLSALIDAHVWRRDEKEALDEKQTLEHGELKAINGRTAGRSRRSTSLSSEPSSSHGLRTWLAPHSLLWWSVACNLGGSAVYLVASLYGVGIAALVEQGMIDNQRHRQRRHQNEPHDPNFHLYTNGLTQLLYPHLAPSPSPSPSSSSTWPLTIATVDSWVGRQRFLDFLGDILYLAGAICCEIGTWQALRSEERKRARMRAEMRRRQQKMRMPTSANAMAVENVS